MHIPFFDDTDEQELYVIPEAALELGSHDFVWTVNSHVQIERKDITVEFIHNGYAYIADGIGKKDWFVITSPVVLKGQLDVDTKI